MITYLPLIICILGLILYMVTSPERPKVAAIAKDMFWVGLFVFLLGFSGWHK